MERAFTFFCLNVLLGVMVVFIVSCREPAAQVTEHRFESGVRCYVLEGRNVLVCFKGNP